MQKEFWLERWQQNQIGFHQEEGNPALREFASELNIAPGDLVFVPLCGKSLDLEWLRQQGYRVLGVELSSIAVNDFFAEQGKEASIATRDSFQSYRNGDIEILCGDYFDLDADMFTDVRAVFDRAALIAMPPEMRPAYADKIGELLQSGTRILLVTMEYPENQMQGPPFSVPEQNVRDLYDKNFSISVLQENDILAREPRFRERGLTSMVEKIYLLQKN
ncbi:MAG: thiopurine S-methyltransferase [Acidiferrobacterales bacterium]